MKPARKTAAWREVLRCLIEDLKESFVADNELADRVWAAFHRFVVETELSGRRISEDHLWALENAWQTRPNLNSIPAELEWVAKRANSTTRRFWQSRELKKALALFRDQRRRMDPSLVRDLNLVHYYLRWR